MVLAPARDYRESHMAGAPRNQRGSPPPQQCPDWRRVEAWGEPQVSLLALGQHFALGDFWRRKRNLEGGESGLRTSQGIRYLGLHQS